MLGPLTFYQAEVQKWKAKALIVIKGDRGMGVDTLAVSAECLLRSNTRYEFITAPAARDTNGWSRSIRAVLKSKRLLCFPGAPVLIMTQFASEWERSAGSPKSSRAHSLRLSMPRL